MSRFERSYWKSPFPQANWQGEFAFQDLGAQSQPTPQPLPSSPPPSAPISRSNSITRIAAPIPTEQDLEEESQSHSSTHSQPHSPSFTIIPDAPIPSVPLHKILTSIPEETDVSALPELIPPAYFQAKRIAPVQAHITLPRGVAYQGTSTMASLTTQVKWSYHPCLTKLRGTDEHSSSSPPGKKKKLLRSIICTILNRPIILYRCIFPYPDSPESLAISPFFPDVVQPSSLIQKTHQHLSELNALIPSHLVKTRLILSLVEIFNYALLILLITALAVTKGNQHLLLSIAEVGIVIGIIVNAAGVNWVRLTRWKLRRQLRLLSRNWSPFLVSRPMKRDPQRQFRDIWDQIGLEEGRRESNSQRNSDTGTPSLEDLEEESTKLRWHMNLSEGGYWTSYRPIIRVELMFPPNKSALTRSRSHSEESHRILDNVGEPPSYSRPDE